MEYRWKGTVFAKADATAVGQELEKLELDGEFSRRDIVRFAKHNEDSELYKCFEWDDTIAGEKYREHQAGLILSSISIVVSRDDKEEETTRAYVSIKNVDGERKHKNIARVLEVDDEYQQLKRKAYSELNNCKERYEKLIELEDLKEIVFELYNSI